jgi:serine/threonine protein kinase
VDPNEIEFGEVLGTGGYGEVRKAVWRGTEVAVKTLLAENASNETRNAFIDEVRVMTTLRHPHVVLFMAASTKPPKLCIVMELMSLGSLYGTDPKAVHSVGVSLTRAFYRYITDVLHNELIPDIPIALRMKILRQAAKGMYFLHSSGTFPFCFSFFCSL